MENCRDAHLGVRSYDYHRMRKLSKSEYKNIQSHAICDYAKPHLPND